MRDIKQYTHQAAIWHDIQCHFNDVKVLGLKSSLPPAKRTALLKRRLLVMSERATPHHQAHFQLSHFHALSKAALDNLCVRGIELFFFAKASRPQGFSLDDFQQCIHDCLNQMPSQA
ncbi:hypothetical protein GQ43DRAFT_471554 [Delitschia confertaspora ATCC 74209]|uniref:Uncharacterized protein n=1 Tax=Delitschia confertaspora ATCC 74209 TaxID=1513339 RepID=A0A9P4JRA4_9PLEO|nr:hypothetical protein GQ43DRAFT_471554 [Delitschia confertaspora ATCC 74209]